MSEEIITPSGMVLAALPEKCDTVLVRNHDMVHLRTCPRVASVIVNPWQWAEGQPVTDIAESRANGIKFCRACEPLLNLRANA